jgi:hypothetical protein
VRKRAADVAAADERNFVACHETSPQEMLSGGNSPWERDCRSAILERP